MAADAGGPLRRDRLWLWGGVARRSLEQDVFTEHEDRLSATSFLGKARVRVGQSHVSLLALRSEKVQDERDATLTAAPEARWRQSGPRAPAGPGRAGNAGRGSRSRRGCPRSAAGSASSRAGERRSPPSRTSAASCSARISPSRPSGRATKPSLEATTSRRFGGFDHRLAAGAGYARSTRADPRGMAGQRGAGAGAPRRLLPRVRPDRLRAPHPRPRTAGASRIALEAHVQDEARRGAFTITGGLRLERLAGHNLPSAVAANPEFPDLLPAVAYDGGPSQFRWVDVLPRLAASWDLSEGSSVGISYAAFAAALGASEVGFDDPIGREVASLTYYWLDRNEDGTVQAGELDLVRGRVGAAGLDPANPGAATSPHAIDPDLRSPRTHALAAAARHTFGAWTGGVHVSWRRLVRPLWRPLRNLTLGDYVIRGAVEGEIHGEPYRVGYYAPASASLIVPGNGRVLANREGYRQDAITAEAVAAGRWARRAPRSVGGVHRLARVLHRPRARGAGPDVASSPTRCGTAGRWRRARAAWAAATWSPTRASPRARRCAGRCRSASTRRPSSTRAKDSRSPTSRSRTPAIRPAAARRCWWRRGWTPSGCPRVVLVDARLSREVRVARGGRHRLRRCLQRAEHGRDPAGGPGRRAAGAGPSARDRAPAPHPRRNLGAVLIRGQDV